MRPADPLVVCRLAAPILVIVAGLLPSQGADRSDDLRRWLDGPVRYIARPEESKEFRRLESDRERAAYIEKFWARRDPTPNTWVNEYRQLFWQRVRESNEKFTDTPGPGWKTDRGKIYILYGPPDESHEDINADVTFAEPDAGRGLLRWIYNSRPGGRRDLDPVVVVPFVRDHAGEYRLSNDPNLASVFFNITSLEDRKSPFAWERWLAASAPLDRSRLSVMLDLGKLQEIPPQEQILLERVETTETFASAPLPLEIDRFEVPGDSRRLVVVTLGLPPASGDEQPGIVVRFTPRDAARSPVVLAEGSFRIESDEAGRAAQGRARLEPGVWDVTALAIEPSADVNRIWRGSVTVSAARESLRTSDPVLAARIENVGYAQLVSYDAPFTIGAFRVRPRVGGQVPRGELAALFLEVYGGRPPYRVSFRLEGREDDDTWRPLTEPQTVETSTSGTGWSLPTTGSWPLGAYRVAIDIEDAAGETVETAEGFTVVEPTRP